MAEERLTRREMMQRGAGAVLAAGALTIGGVWLHDRRGDRGLKPSEDAGARLKNYYEKVDFPASNPRISVAVGDDGRIEQMVRSAIGGLDPRSRMSRFVGRGDVVLIKPNVGFDRAPFLGATSNPEVVRWVIRLCREAGAGRILITDNPIESPEACFAKSGIARVADEEGAEVVLPARARFESVAIRDRLPDPAQGEAISNWPVLLGPLADADKVIGIAPVKDHNLSSASMNLKNWYGLLGGRRNQFHQSIHHIISDLAMMMSPTLVIADATRVMMRNGPTGGRISDVAPGGILGKPAVVASVDPVAGDAWCYEHLLGRDPANLTYLELAQSKIAAQVAGGWRRLGERDWRVYANRGLIAETSI